MKYWNYAIAIVAVLVCAGISAPAQAACSDGTTTVNSVELEVQSLGDVIRYTGSCEDDNELLFTTGSMVRYDACWVMSRTGSVDVEVSINDGTTYNTATPLTLYDFSVTDGTDAASTTALQMYAFPGPFTEIRVRQNGATDAAADLFCFID